MTLVLVTGASGFIGGHLVDRLVASGRSVRGLVRGSSRTDRLRGLGIELQVADLASDDCLDAALADVETVFHVAGVTHTPRPAEQIMVNRDAVSRLLEAASRRAEPPRFVLVSSVAAAGPVPRGTERTESDPPQPISRYGESKLAGEVAAGAWAGQVPITVVRPGIVFGPRDRNMLPLFKMISRTGIHVVPAFRPPRLSLIHVLDLVELLVRVASDDVCLEPAGSNGCSPRGCYFGCASEYPTYAELGSMIGAAVGRKRVIRLPMPGLLPWLVAAINEGVGRLRNRSSTLRVDKIREARATCWACSGAAAERELGFLPTRSIPERLEETAAWYRENGLL